MAPLEKAAAPERERREARRVGKEEYMVGELREDLELMGAQGIIDEGGRR